MKPSVRSMFVVELALGACEFSTSEEGDDRTAVVGPNGVRGHGAGGDAGTGAAALVADAG